MEKEYFNNCSNHINYIYDNSGLQHRSELLERNFSKACNDEWNDI
ncbi:MAG: hypothetical protein RHS_5566 [Robinsoniella sp. RHS]|nr:MAG: hypothetical protein RHS_5566 [Robinsoniella sp. RHS]